MAPNKLTTGANTNDGVSYTTATITPGADRLVMAFVVNVAAFFQAAPAPTVSGNGLDWDLVDSIQMGERRLSCFVGRGAAPSAGPVSVACGNITQTLCAWSIFEYDVAPGNARSVISGHHTDGPRNVSALSVTPNPGLGPNEVAIGGVMLDASQPVAAGAGCIQIDVQNPTQPFAPSATLHTEDRTSPGDVGWAWKDNANAAAIVLAVKLPASGGPQPFDPLESIVRQFEPILFFDPAEAAFPSDAKRYLEHCALWKASATPFNNQQSWPIDNQHSWQKLVPAGQLSAAAGEPGKFIGDAVNSLDTAAEERFLELGGWLDMVDGNAVTTVPDDGVLRYANRAEIRARYATVPALRDSQFWYHAEFFDTGRLTSLAESMHTPNLYPLVADLHQPALLCYYLFFPEHEQAVQGNNWEAEEVGSYAGQWSCVALLLERADDQAPYTEPSYIGFTGTPPTAPTPQASDPEQRITMKLAPWQSPLHNTDGHPHLYVSPGTHSLYLDNTPHAVAPFPSAPPYNGGLWDGAPTQGVDNDDLTVFYLKLYAGAAVVTLVAAGIEALFLDFGTHPEEFGAADPVPPDAAAAPGGVTVHPAGMVPREEWTRPQTWRSAHTAANGRQYDYIVNRSAQPWWPSHDHTSGFRGRWGQRVERDRLPRRAGVRFPEFWRLFLLALEDGRQRGLLPKK